MNPIEHVYTQPAETEALSTYPITSPQLVAAIRAAACLGVDAQLAETLLCDVYADNPQEGLRIFWLLCGDGLRRAVDAIETAARLDKQLPATQLTAATQRRFS